MQVKNVVSYLESLYPLASQASFDNCGLLVGNPENEIKGILICLDCIEEVVEEAILTNCNLIIAHHPIIFKGIKKIVGENYVERILIKAIQNNISLYAIHTNLDHSLRGVNFEIANRLGIVNPKILIGQKDTLVKLAVNVPSENLPAVQKAIFAAGGGMLGNYSECSFIQNGIGSFTPMESARPYLGEKGEMFEGPEQKIEVIISKNNVIKAISNVKKVHPYEEVAYDVVPLGNVNEYEGSGMIGELEEPVDALTFLAKIKQTFHCGSIRYTNIIETKIKRVAFCGGSGSFLLKDALRQNADIFITADFKYHEFFDAEDKIIIADIGHYESEQFTSDLIYRILTEKFVNFAIRITTINTNPINYF
jgi:dinuclear metal center YbgI/SA1388 family protein